MCVCDCIPTVPFLLKKSVILSYVHQGTGIGSFSRVVSGAMLLDPGLHFARLEAARAIDFDRGQAVSEQEVHFDFATPKMSATSSTLSSFFTPVN